jgi:hypothetical protein
MMQDLRYTFEFPSNACAVSAANHSYPTIPLTDHLSYYSCCFYARGGTLHHYCHCSFVLRDQAMNSQQRCVVEVARNRLYLTTQNVSSSIHQTSASSPKPITSLHQAIVNHPSFTYTIIPPAASAESANH